jgi:microcystin-dependent protein
MSKIALTPHASGTGTLNIAAPDTSTNRTLTLPDETGTVLTSASSLASANLTGALPAISGAALTSLTSANLTGALPAISGAALTDLSGTPTGALLYFAASTAPTGFIKANGASLDTTTYADLFAIVGYTYGGSGASFTLPDLRGEFMRGWDDARGADSGRSFGSAQADELKAHTHTYMKSNNYGGSSGHFGWYASFAAATNTSSAGGTETRPRNIALLACIKY